MSKKPTALIVATLTIVAISAMAAAVQPNSDTDDLKLSRSIVALEGERLPSSLNSPFIIRLLTKLTPFCENYP